MLRQDDHPSHPLRLAAALTAAFLAAMAFGVLLLVSGDPVPGAVILAFSVLGLGAVMSKPIS